MKKNLKRDSSKIDKIVYLAIGISFLTVMVGGLALLPSTSGIIGNIVGEVEFPDVSFENLETDSNQDHYVVCPESTCPEQSIDIQSPTYNASVAEMRSRLLSFVDNRPNITLKNLDLVLQQFDFIERVPGTGFPDIVTVRIIQNMDGTCNLAIYSRSVIGEGAEGSNKRRAENWLLVFEALK